MTNFLLCSVPPCSTPHGSTGVRACHMLYGVEMTMPLDLVIGDVGREWSDVHCPMEYMEWLCGSIRDAHAITRTNLIKKSYGETSQSAVFQRGDWVWHIYPPVNGGNKATENECYGWCWQIQVLLLIKSNTMPGLSLNSCM